MRGCGHNDAGRAQDNIHIFGREFLGASSVSSVQKHRGGTLLFDHIAQRRYFLTWKKQFSLDEAKQIGEALGID